jgi:hypothetical protein
MECKAEYSVLGTDNLFAQLGFNPCVIGVLEFLMICCVFGVLNIAIYHVAVKAITWLRWFRYKIDTHAIDDHANVDRAAAIPD